MNRTRILLAAFLAVAVCAADRLVFGNVGIGLLDEGHLWYGVVRTAEGQVPMRDFQSYDPGRYYWCAAWAKLLGSGLLDMRTALAAFRGLGLFFALLAVGRVVAKPWHLVPACLLLFAWLFPGHKVFEAGLSMIAVGLGVLLIERPTVRRHLFVGVFVGLAGWFGRNHGLYTAVSFTLLSLFLSWKGGGADRLRRLTALIAGMFFGYAPGWIMLLFVPGFAAGFYESTVLFMDKGVNVPRPFPWPWRSAADGLIDLSPLGNLARSVSFMLPLVAYPIGVVLALRTPGERVHERACLIAATFVGITYLHHASVRADLFHLAECIQPLLILLIALPCAFGTRRWPGLLVWGVLALTTAGVVAARHPLIERLFGGDKLVEYPVAGQVLRMKSNRAGYLERLEAVVDHHVGPDEELYVGPARPMLYPILGKRSPTWWISIFWKMNDEEQFGIIEDLERRGVDWALIIDKPIDRREDLRFAAATPLLARYLEKNFEEIQLPFREAARLLHRRSGPERR